jgi:hypothetical protein
VQFKEIFIDLVNYGFPTVALGLSIYSFVSARKAGKLTVRLTELEMKLKKYELEEKERQREQEARADVHARIVKLGQGKYRLKISNQGGATAYNVNFTLPSELQGMILKDKVPFDFLEPQNGFEEHVIIYAGFPQKLKITLTWTDKDGITQYRDEMLSI